MRSTAFSCVVLLVLSFVSLSVAAEEKISGVSPQEALKRLEDGNKRFVEGKLQHPRADQARIKETAQGQQPFATILSCSDSRVPVEVVFDQGIGDLFVIRVAGNVCDFTQLGTTKYGVEPLGSRLCVVMGHTKCGAVAAACTLPDGEGHVLDLIRAIRPAVQRAEAETGKSGAEIVEPSARENVFVQIETLFKGSASLREAARKGDFVVVGAIYDIETGKVTFLGPHPKNDELVKESNETQTTQVRQRPMNRRMPVRRTR